MADIQIYNLSNSEVLARYKSSVKGLDESEAARRLKLTGLNELTTKTTPLWKRLLEPFASYFVMIIIVAALLSVYEQKWLEAGVISVIIITNALIYYIQQFSVNKALKSLRAQDKLKVNMVRGGKTITILSEQLVPGDIVHLVEGVKVPADGRLIEANALECDESVLTGESLPVRKQDDAVRGHKPIYEQANMLFKGTYVNSGTGLLLVTATGDRTQLGTINTLASQADEGKTPIERKIDALTKKVLIGIGGISVLTFGLVILRGIALDEATRFTLSVIVSAVPEGLPVILTLVLMLTARKLATQKALVKNLAAIETMGAVTLIATDKTGTITRNKLSVADTFTLHSNQKVFDEAIKASLNSESQDPLDNLLHGMVDHMHIPASWKKLKEFPFDQKMRLSGSLWQQGSKYVLYLKGAPEQILHHCKHTSINPQTYIRLKEFTGRGYRTIAFAQKTFTRAPNKLNTANLTSLSFAGFVGLSDQLRPLIHKAIAEARAAGIKVIMLTGDHVETAQHIAHVVGIAKQHDEVASGELLAEQSPAQVLTTLQTIRVFGRVLPEHKYALLKAVKKTEIAAMTGDGVNDIPALVEADVGLAMGSGSDAAKDSSDIVLVNSNFHTIVNAVRMGRTLIANIRKMVVYLLGTNTGEVLTTLGALVLGLPLPLTAIMILWVNLVTDGVSVIPLGLSPPEGRHMHMPPEDPHKPLLNASMITRSIVLAVTMAVTVLVVFKLNLPNGLAYAQTTAFLSLIVVQWANAFNMNFEFKSWLHNFVAPNYKLVGLIAVSIAVNGLIFMTPLGKYFGIVPIAAFDAFVAIVFPITAALVTCDIHKLFAKHLRA